MKYLIAFLLLLSSCAPLPVQALPEPTATALPTMEPLPTATIPKWQVCADWLYVREKPTTDSAAPSFKVRGEWVYGVARNGWVKVGDREYLRESYLCKQ